MSFMAWIRYLLLLLAFPAFARDVTVTWELATERVDSTPLPVSEIAATRIEWGSCASGAFGTQAGVRDIAPPALTTVLGWCKLTATPTDVTQNNTLTIYNPSNGWFVWY